MKTKYIILSLAAALTLSACVKESDNYLDSIRVSSSFVTIPTDGGSKKITIDATGDWTFDFDIEVDTTYVDPIKGSKTEKITRNQLTQFYDIDSLDATTGKEVITHWLTIAPASGKKGKTEVTFTALPRPSAKQVTVYLKSGDQVQNIILSLVETNKAEVPVSTVKEIAAGADGKTFRAKGYCTRITSTSYGNWYLSDATVDGSTVKELYVYGTVDATGSYNWSSFNIAVGDLVTVEGPKTTYSGTIELVDARVIEVQKALLIADKTEYTVTKDNTPFEVKMKQNGETFIFESKSDWLTIDKNYDLTGGTVTVKVTPEENTTGKVRTGTLWFQSTLLGKDKKGNPKRDTTQVNIAVTQLSATAEGNLLAVRNACNNSKTTPFDFTIGKATVTYVSGTNIFIEDESAGLYIYDKVGNVKLTPGQTVTGRVYGEGNAYKGLPEATKFYYELATVGEAPKLSADLPKPKEVTLAQLASNWDDYFCRFIKIDDVAVTDTVAARFEYVETNEDGTPKTYQDSKTKEWKYSKSSGDRSGKIAEDTENKTNEIAVSIQFKKFLNMDADKRYSVIGTACKYNSNQIYIWDPSHVKEVKAAE